VRTQYEYDPQTFRLTHLFTTRGTSFPDDCENPIKCDDPPRDCPKSGDFSCGLQNIHYIYDPAGNIIVIKDDAQQTIYFNGQVVKPKSEYRYDVLYRLIETCGREHEGSASQPETTWNDEFRVGLEHPHDGQKMRNYFEYYTYDEVGNILKFDHKARNNRGNNSGDWIRTYDYSEDSLIEPGKNNNRLSSTTVRSADSNYRYDEHGNMIRMPHFKHNVPYEQNMYWDFKDQLQMVDKGNNCKAYYIYDGSGERVRKVIEQNDAPLEERIYLGGFEVYHKYGTNPLERETLHIMDDKQRIAMVDSRTIGNEPDVPEQLIRYQFGNHLGSASLELDPEAQIISYEEYYPYGSTSYQAVRKDIEVSLKRYRYTGKERDEETGLNYHGARYYAPWLTIWLSCDPKSPQQDINCYRYVRGNPVKLIDPNGKAAMPATPEQMEAISEITEELKVMRPKPFVIPAADNSHVMRMMPDGTFYMGGKSDAELEARAISREMSIERANKTKGNICGGVFGAAGYLGSGDEGSDRGAIADAALTLYSPHPVNSQMVVNAPAHRLHQKHQQLCHQQLQHRFQRHLQHQQLRQHLLHLQSPLVEARHQPLRELDNRYSLISQKQK
jgi:RHS repeat-associated protein